MCLVLLYLGDRSAGDQEEVILASNRDEFFGRPTERSAYYFDPDTACHKAFNAIQQSNNTSDKCSKRPRVILGPRDLKQINESYTLLGAPFMVGSGKRWAIVTNAQGVWKEHHHQRRHSTSIPVENRAQCHMNSMPYNDTSDVQESRWFFYSSNQRLVLFSLSLLCTTFIGSVHVVTMIAMALVGVSAIWFMMDRRTTTTTNETKTDHFGSNHGASRGQLLASFVNSNVSPCEFVEALSARGNYFTNKFDGFSLLIGVGNDAYFLSNRSHDPDSPNANGIYSKQLKKGIIYGLSNAYLDDSVGKVSLAKALFLPMVKKLGCMQGTHAETVPISDMERNEVVQDILESVLGNTDDCEIRPTCLIPRVDKRLAHIRVEPFEALNPGTGAMDIYGTRDQIVMTISFKKPNDYIEMHGTQVWELDHSVSPCKMLAFNEKNARRCAR
mmetsp:Transcript_15079/g.27333  ORF Transcript_15079/g.27333 Transcript_15079/m.27333 type:complete len:442 (-) Transcript_15079:1152-2477(-)